MITPTHALMGAALFRGRAEAWAAAAGGVAPDIPSFALVAWAAAQGLEPQEIFRDLYFSESWQTAMAPSHAAPLWALGLAAALVLRNGAAAAFGASGLLHQAADFLTHADDPHRHLWPLSDWRFRSPVSYWDPRHGGEIFGPLEIALALALSVLLVRRFPALWLKVALGLVLLAYLAQYVAGLLFFSSQAL